LREVVPEYHLYNGLALTSLINRMGGMMEEKHADFVEDLSL